MIFEDIYNDIKSSFGSLWNFKERGDSLEIITPFVTTSHKFASVFLTKRGNDFIVSDGGWIADGVYGNDYDTNVGCYSKIISHYIDCFQIKQALGNSKMPFFYKKTDKQIVVPSLIFDLANFVSALVSLAEIEYEAERKPYDLFSKSANDYLSNLFVGKFETNVYFDLTTRHVKPNAIITKENGKVLLINYITGSNISNFQSSIGKATVIFELAEKTVSLIKDKIEKKITLIDDTSAGYDINKVNPWLNNLTDKPGIKRVDWSKKEEILKIY